MPVATPIETLEILLVSPESGTATTVHAGVSKMGGAAESAESAGAACEFVAAHKIDGVILDLEIRSALDVIRHMRQTKNARAFAFVCVNNDAEEAVALKGGANAILTKPLTAETVASRLHSFRSIIVSERRRYQRHDVLFPATIVLAGNTYQGIVENISQGGMAV